MSAVQSLREFVNERLTAAAEEILRVYEKMIVEYEEEIDRQRRLLDIVWKPEIKLHRLEELPQQQVCKEEEEVFADQQLGIQENSSLDQEDPEPPQIKEEQEQLCTSEEGEQLVLKQETDAFMLIPTYEENDHSEDQTLDLKRRKEEIEEDIDCQRRMLDIVWKPEIKLHRLEHLQQHVCKEERKEEEEEVLADHQLCIQERNSSLDQEDPEPPQIKEEQEQLCTNDEGEQLVLKQETDAFMLTPTYEENDHSEDQTLDLKIANTQSVVEEMSLSYTSVKSSVVPEPNSDQQLLSHNSQKAESQDQKGGKPGDSGLTKNTKQKQQNHHHTNYIYNPTISKIQCNTSTGQKTFKCDTCEKVFKCQSKLQRHSIIHTDERPFSCKTCGGTFRSSSNLNAHMRSHTGEKPFKCRICGKAYKFSSGLQVHMRSHTGEMAYACNTCGEEFNSSIVLRVHMKTHTGDKPYICKTCGKDFISDRLLNVHMRTHTGERPYCCKVCEKRFNIASNLTKHMRIHTGEKPYTCKTCGKNFISSTVLNVHVRIHTGEKPFACKICGKDFGSSYQFKVHMRIHTGEKPFPCKACGKRFCAATEMKRHMRIHTGEKPYTCKTCGKKFSFNSGLKKHMRSHTDEELPHCSTEGPVVVTPHKRRRRKPRKHVDKISE